MAIALSFPFTPHSVLLYWILYLSKIDSFALDVVSYHNKTSWHKCGLTILSACPRQWSQVVAALFLFLACAQLYEIGRARRCPFASQRLVPSNNITDKFTLWSIVTHLVPLHVVFADLHLVLLCLVLCIIFVKKSTRPAAQFAFIYSKRLTCPLSA